MLGATVRAIASRRYSRRTLRPPLPVAPQRRLLFGFLRFELVRDARPGEKFLERSGNLLVGYRIRVREKDRAVRLPHVVSGSPVEISFAIRTKAKTFAPSLRTQVDGKFLTLKIKRQKSFDPFRGVLGFPEIVRIGVWPANLKSLRQNRLVIVVKRKKALRKKRPDSPLYLVCLGMHEPPAKRVAGRLVLLGSQPILKLMNQPASAKHGNENCEGHDEGPKGLGEQSLHQVIILEE